MASNTLVINECLLKRLPRALLRILHGGCPKAAAVKPVKPETTIPKAAAAKSPSKEASTRKALIKSATFQAACQTNETATKSCS
jgi:hypothetical protein